MKAFEITVIRIPEPTSKKIAVKAKNAEKAWAKALEQAAKSEFPNAQSYDYACGGCVCTAGKK